MSGEAVAIAAEIVGSPHSVTSVRNPQAAPGVVVVCTTVKLALQQLRFTRSPRFSLGPLDLHLASGEHVLVLGNSGSGKSTLLKLLAGLLRPDQGSLRWDEEDPWALSAEQRRDRQAAFGMVFQSDALFDSDTVLQNVQLPLLKRGVPKGEAHARAEEALAQVGLTPAASQLPEQLSGGMKKRVGIARAIVARPQILLADDPLAGLDPHTARKVSEVLQAAAAGRTLIVAMPDPVPELRLARVVRLEKGLIP